MVLDRAEGGCRYNQNIICQQHNCGSCGWNPIISEERLLKFLKKNGIEKKEPDVRLINAVDAQKRIQASVIPMAEMGRDPWQIYSAVMKCLDASATLLPKELLCVDCAFAKYPYRRSIVGCMVCGNAKSPCNRRKVMGWDYCPYGERKQNGKN